MIARLRRRMTLLVAAVLLLVTAGIVFSINYMNWRNIVSRAESALETLASNSGARPELKKSGEEKVWEDGELTPPEKLEGEGEKEPPEKLEGEDEKEPPEKPEGEDEKEPPEKPEGEGEKEPPEKPEGEDEKESPEKPEGEDEKEPSEKPEGDAETEPGRRSDMGKGTPGDGIRKPSRGQPLDSENTLASLSNYYVVTLASDNTVKSWTSDRSDLYSDEQVQDMTDVVLSEGKESGYVGTQFYRISAVSGKKLLIVLDERLEIQNARSVFRMTLLIASIACVLLCIAAYILIWSMVRPVQEAFDRQRQFVWDASHELKTPLAVIGANADVLQGEIGDSEHLGYIRSEVKRTDRLLQNLLTLARMDKGTLTAKLQDLDLGQTVLSVALPFESTAFEAGRRFEMDVPEGIHCSGDKEMLQQLTVILLSNALKYSEEGGRIRVSVTTRGRNREIKVSNTGEGIAPKDMERIFDRFYRVDSSHNREVEGNGLGLSIAKNIVDAHRGKIKVTSEPFQETEFTVSLPM